MHRQRGELNDEQLHICKNQQKTEKISSPKKKQLAKDLPRCQECATQRAHDNYLRAKKSQNKKQAKTKHLPDLTCKLQSGHEAETVQGACAHKRQSCPHEMSKVD